MKRSWLLLVCLAVVAVAGALTLFAAPRLRPVRLPAEVPGELVMLPFANFGQPPSSWETTLVLTNASDTPITVPRFYADTPVGGPTVIVPPKRAIRFNGWPREGGGIEDIEVPDWIEAETEIRNPNGMTFRVGAMPPAVTAGQSIEWLGLRSDGEFRSVILIGVRDEGAALEIETFDGTTPRGTLRDYVLSHGVVILNVPAGVTRIVARHGSAVGPAPTGPFWAVAWVWHEPLLETVKTIEPTFHDAPARETP